MDYVLEVSFGESTPDDSTETETGSELSSVHSESDPEEVVSVRSVTSKNF